ncbi:hypothetical protein ACFOZ7_10035 [Natribaculum luteum]|uniref:Small CPxCG-related zinc finger protein n=1 Tax=Natribaculum luteum TaxID=1586232 RepID=A0ABD5NZB5_9EURY|nr:hypothetical protein [Natribaculum luteum]
MSGSIDSESVDSESSPESFPPCPRCDTPVADVTTVGPTAQYARSCGCRIPVGALESSD